MTLKPFRKRIVRVVGSLAFCLVWNGFVSMFLSSSDEASGMSFGGRVVLLTPFWLIGLLAIYGCFGLLFSLFNPQAILTLERPKTPLGETLRVRWHLLGPVRRLKKIRFVLRGIEKASYEHGSSTATDERAFYEVALAEHDRIVEMTNGTLEHTLPHDLMYSLTLPNNEIVWRLEVHGEIGLWPDVNDGYEITLLPCPVEAEQQGEKLKGRS